ncbi:MAG: hypothetical protein ABJM39_09585 [Porticoccus sp.]|uniref:hypothetical protein n=1 Tax=Porticoccus sp. TaxID=2024853 RepID=UPI003296C0BF
MATPILNIPELAAGQATPYATANAMGRALEAAANDFLSVDLSSGNVALTAAQYRGYVLFRASGNTVARDLTLQAIKRLVIIDNSDGTATLSIKLGATTLTLSAGEKALYYTDGTANGLVAAGGIDINAYDTDTSPDAAADFLLTYDTSASAHKKVLIENLPFSGGGGSSAAGEDKNPIAILTDTKTAGTDGGTATSGTDITRDINTVNHDPDSIVSLSSNQVTLQAGTYKIDASAPSYDARAHSAWLYNVTDSVIPSGGEGSVEFCDPGSFIQSRSFISCVLTIPSAKVFEIRHRVSQTKTGNGLGNAGASWNQAVFTIIKIVKLTAYEQRYTIGRRTIDFASDANYTLSTTAGAEEWKDKFLTITDTGVVLTAGRDIIFPDENGPEYIFTNDTAQTLTCKRSGQTGVAVAAGNTVRIYHDGTDMVAAP